jgi:hypothetical protein
MLEVRGLTSACCLLCGAENPPGEFDFDAFWVRDERDWSGYTGGPVHRICAAKMPKPPGIFTRLSVWLGMTGATASKGPPA